MTSIDAPLLQSSPPETLPRRAGRLLNGIRLHAVQRVEIDGRAWYSKRRREGADTFLIAVNTYLRSFGLDVRFLRGDAWMEWELRLHQLLRGVPGQRDDRGVLLPEVPGIQLDRYLRGVAVTSSQVDRALRAAAASLAGLHSLQTSLHASLGNSQEWPLTHGDAVLRNVLFDPVDGRAHWIDFETRHVPNAPAARRRADDVWTFARSAVAHLGEERASQVAAIVANTCVDNDVRIALRSGITLQRVGENLFRQAQAPLPRATMDRLAIALTG